MSEGMFLGRKFTIPYDTTTDQQVSSMARAQMITRTATPGTVIQVGDTVMAYGVTPQQAKMGDLDVRLRSFEQISNQAQEAVRRNIQWQYGEQVGEADPMKKGFLAELFGMPHLSKPFEVLYPPVKPGAKPAASSAPAATTPAATAPAAATPAPAAKRKSPKSVSTTNPSSGQVDIITPGDARHPEAAAATAPAFSKKPSQKRSAKTAVPTAAPTTPFGQGMPNAVHADLVTAFHTLARRHKDARGSDWSMSTHYDGLNARSLAVHGPSKSEEYHEIGYHPESGGFIHRHMGPLMKKPVETKLDSVDALYNHVISDNDKWAF